MPDITMCRGNGCKIKDNCYRHRAEPSEFRQSWFMDPPFDTDYYGCEYFWELEPEIQE